MNDRVYRIVKSVELAVGLAGLASTGRFLWLIWLVGHSPGDDNAIVLLFALGAVVALLPGAGLPLWWMRRRRSAFDVLFCVAGLAVLAVILPFLWLFRDAR